MPDFSSVVITGKSEISLWTYTPCYDFTVEGIIQTISGYQAFFPLEQTSHIPPGNLLICISFGPYIRFLWPKDIIILCLVWAFFSQKAQINEKGANCESLAWHYLMIQGMIG